MQIREEIHCREVENLLQPFLENRLHTDELKALLAHLDSCDDCSDELEVRYLLTEGLKRLEAGESFDLEKELEDRIEHARDRILLIDRIQTGTVLTAGVFLFLFIVYLVVNFAGH